MKIFSGVAGRWRGWREKRKQAREEKEIRRIDREFPPKSQAFTNFIEVPKGLRKK